MDISAAAIMLFLLAPLLLAIAIAIRIASGKPVIFRQWRTGRFGREFLLLKFRTMSVQPANKGIGVTRDGDPRVTAIGRLLRRSKLDELLQLVNVLRGEMSLVGPRPDLKEFWQQSSADASQALRLTPGLTSPASIAFRNEERLLAYVSPEQMTKFYVERLLPAKAKIDLEYAVGASFRTDCSVLLQTATAALRIGSGSQPLHKIHEQLSR
jgi:lipopolysaccharide/colanic/teichoic acid biosynthesis glycosyltransferase